MEFNSISVLLTIIITIMNRIGVRCGSDEPRLELTARAEEEEDTIFNFPEFDYMETPKTVSLIEHRTISL
jgi:hypothetical protein